MDFHEYQTKSRKTWGDGVATLPAIAYQALGLANEAGEVGGKVKKIYRDKAAVVSEADRQELKHELGDVLWYLTQLCTDLDLSLESVAEANIKKLSSRLERGVVRGNGDNR